MDSSSTNQTHHPLICPNCRAEMEPHWKFCIGCGLHPDPSLLKTLSHIDYALQDISQWVALRLTDAQTAHRISSHYLARRAQIIAAALSATAPHAAPAAETSSPSAPPGPVASKTPPPPSKTLLERLSDPATLKLMVYGGSLMIVLGALIYLRDIIATQLRQPLTQMALLTGTTLATFFLGAWLLRRTQEELAGRGLLLLGSLLIPLNPWFAVHAGLIPRGNRAWMVGALCTAIYGAAAFTLGETLLLHLAIPAALLTAFGFLDSVMHASPAAYAWTLAAFSLASLHASQFAQRARHAATICAPPLLQWSCIGLTLTAFLYAGLYRWLPPESLAAFGTNAIASVSATTTIGVAIASAYGFGVLALQRRNEPLAYVALALPAIVALDVFSRSSATTAATLLGSYAAAVAGCAVYAKRQHDKRSTHSFNFISHACARFSFATLMCATPFALASFNASLCAALGLECLLFGNFLWNRKLGILQIALGALLATASYLQTLEKFGFISTSRVSWLFPALAAWLLLLQFALWNAERLERSVPTRADADAPEFRTPALFAGDRRWSQTLFFGSLVFAAPLVIGLGLFVFFFMSASLFFARTDATDSSLIRSIFPETLGASLIVLWAVWGLRRKATFWHSTTFGISVYALFLFAIRPVNAGAGALALAIIGFSIVFRIVAELFGANLAGEYSTNTGTSFGLDFGLPKNPIVKPLHVIANAVVFLTACTSAAGRLNGAALRATALEPVLFLLIVAYCAFCGFFADTPRRSFIHYLFASFSATAALAFGLADWLGVYAFAQLPYLAGAAALAYFSSSFFEGVSGGDLARALRTTSLFILGALCCLALGNFAPTRAESIGSVIVFLTAALCAGRLAIAGDARAGYAALLGGLLAYARILRIAEIPTDCYPAATLIYGFTAIALGVQYLPKLTMRIVKRSPEAADVPIVFENGGHAIGGFSLFFIFLMGTAIAPFEETERAITLLTLMLGVIATAAVSVISPRPTLRERYSVASLALGILLYARLLLFSGFDGWRHIEAFSVPIGAALILTGWLKLPGSDAQNHFGKFYVWLGSFLLCTPSLVHTLQLRLLEGRSSWIRDILFDSVALVAVGAGILGRLRGPFLIGLATFSLHLAVVVVDSIHWGAIPYAVYLVSVGLFIGASGWLLSRKRRELEKVQDELRANWQSRVETFYEWR